VLQELQERQARKKCPCFKEWKHLASWRTNDSDFQGPQPGDWPGCLFWTASDDSRTRRIAPHTTLAILIRQHTWPAYVIGDVILLTVGGSLDDCRYRNVTKRSYLIRRWSPVHPAPVTVFLEAVDRCRLNERVQSRGLQSASLAGPVGAFLLLLSITGSVLVFADR